MFSRQATGFPFVLGPARVSMVVDCSPIGTRRGEPESTVFGPFPTDRRGAPEMPPAAGNIAEREPQPRPLRCQRRCSTSMCSRSPAAVLETSGKGADQRPSNDFAEP